MGIRILEGLDFDRRDIRGGAKTVNFNRRFAEHFSPSPSAIVRRRTTHEARAREDRRGWRFVVLQPNYVASSGVI